MRQITTTMTQRGQVTVPAEVRRLLGLAPRSKLTFQIEGEQVRIVPAAYTLESTYGAVTPINRPENFKEIERQAKEEHVERVMQKMRRQ